MAEPFRYERLIGRFTLPLLRPALEERFGVYRRGLLLTNEYAQAA
jgi:hypothetical protein